MHSSRDRLRILLIDDQPERFAELPGLIDDVADVAIEHPLDVTSDDFAHVHLVSVDEYFEDERWRRYRAETAATAPAALQVLDGLATAAAIRSRARLEGGGAFAVTLHTGAIRDLAGNLPTATRESLVAAQHDLEWVFEVDAPGFALRLAAVAGAARALAETGQMLSDDAGAAWLDLPSASWSSTALTQIEDCRPPAHSLARDSRGRSYLRWLAHRVLPYPTFLLSREHAANLLGVDLESFERLESDLTSLRYVGPLARLTGPRWWRAGLQQVLVDAGVYQWDAASVRVEALISKFDHDLTALTHDEPVVTYDRAGRVVDIDADPEQAVRLQQDGWPVWADDPWATFDDIEDDPELHQLVAKIDRARLPHSDDDQ